MLLKLILVLLSCACLSSGQEVELLYDSQSLRICVDKDFTDPCSQIDRDQQASCRRVATKTDCILDADAGQPLLATLTAEEALVGAPLVSGRAVVIGEINQATAPYQTVVIVRSSFAGGFTNLSGLRYCHPGYKHDELVTKYVLEELDWKSISLNCSNGTIEEQKFAALAGLFGSSCRPGQWVEDNELDVWLKSQYPSLCSLCGTSGCDTNYQSPFSDTLTCLSSSGGDLALTSLTAAQTFFNASSGNVDNYKYLCSDGNVSDANNPCVWTKQMPRLIITSSDQAVIMQTYLTRMPWYIANNFSMTTSPSDFENYLATVLEISKNEKIDLKMATPLSTYVSSYRTIPSNVTSQQCGMSVRWSTLNELEQAKCQWLAQAAINVGLQPIISCIQNANGDILSSLDDVKNGVADIVYADASYGYVARRKNLSNIAYIETDHRQLSKISLLIRNSTNFTFTSFNDFKGKSICLPEYGGKEWLAWIDFLRQSQILDNASCDYGTMFSDFVGQSCAPGAISSAYDIPGTNSDKLCANCIAVNNTLPAKYCNADADNKYYGSEGVLKCLTDGSADYGIISTSEIRHLRLRTDAYWSDFQVVNRNGTLTTYTGIQIDEDSPLTIITAGEVLIGSNSSKYNDTMLLLRNIEKQFGQNLEKPFKVFFQFNRTRNLLFPDSTPGLFFGQSRSERYIENYRTLIANSQNCYLSSGSSAYFSSVTLLSVVVLQVFIRYF